VRASVHACASHEHTHTSCGATCNCTGCGNTPCKVRARHDRVFAHAHAAAHRAHNAQRTCRAPRTAAAACRAWCRCSAGRQGPAAHPAARVARPAGGLLRCRCGVVWMLLLQLVMVAAPARPRQPAAAHPGDVLAVRAAAGEHEAVHVRTFMGGPWQITATGILAAHDCHAQPHAPCRRAPQAAAAAACGPRRWQARHPAALRVARPSGRLRRQREQVSCVRGLVGRRRWCTGAAAGLPRPGCWRCERATKHTERAQEEGKRGADVHCRRCGSAQLVGQLYERLQSRQQLHVGACGCVCAARAAGRLPARLVGS
jgi:hypothetical protein